MKSKFIALFVLLMAAGAQAGQEQWTTDVDRAMGEAKADKKILFLNFTTGAANSTVSKFNKEILGQDQFYAYAKDNGLILVDIIMGPKKPKDSAMAKQHQETVKKYNVQKCPLVIIADSEGKPLGELGYATGGPGPFIAKVAELVKKNAAK